MKKMPLFVEQNLQPATGDPTSIEKKKILKARAKKLSREPEKDKSAETYLEVVVFILAYETYAIETSFVREIFPLKEFTPLPCTPPFVSGIINVRGQILSVIDIKKLFELPEKGLGELNKVIILHKDDMEFGILADRILGTRSIPLEDIQPSLPTLKDVRVKYLKGVTGDRVVILDVTKIMSDKKIIVHEEIGT